PLLSSIASPHVTRSGGILHSTSTVLSACLFRQQRPTHRMAFLFTLLLALAFVAVVSALALLDRNPAVPAGRDPATARLLYEDHGRSGVAPFALMAEKRQFWAHDHLSFLAFGCRAGTALALGPAIGPSSSAGDLQEEFRAVCRRRGWRPAFYQVSRKAAADLPATVRLNI